MNYGGYFDFEKRNAKIKELETKTLENGFWDNRRESTKIINELNANKNIIKEAEELKNRITSNLELLNEIKETNDIDTALLLEEEIEEIRKKIDELEVKLLLNNEYDENDAILEIHSGAGGTEACDWANMLKRMYTRWCEKKGYTCEIID